MGLQKRSKVSAEFNMSSLTDIVFLLLIFFMLTSSLVNPTAINLKLPNSSKTPATSTAKPLQVKVDADKKIKFNNMNLDVNSLKAQLTRAVMADGRPTDQITVILDVHENVDAQTLVSVVDVMNGLGVKMILATKLTD